VLVRLHEVKMKISEVCSIVEAVRIMTELTQRAWTEAEFAHEVIRLRLPIYAAAPFDALIVSKRYVDGRLVITPEPSMTAQYVTLLQSEIEELASSVGPQVVTDRPAWLFGDKPYRTWDEIVAFRQGYHRVLGHWEADQGEWMGQSDEYFFSAPVQVTADSTFAVPRHTIAELAKDDLQRAQFELAGGVKSVPPVPVLQTPTTASATVGRDRVGAPEPLGITKNQVLAAFSHLTDIDLAKALANGKGLYSKAEAKVVDGTPGSRHAALWNPVILAVGFYEKYGAPRAKLNRVFTDNQFLAPWWEKWKEQADDLL
jgi:hypothetical protein